VGGFRGQRHPQCCAFHGPPESKERKFPCYVGLQTRVLGMPMQAVVSSRIFPLQHIVDLERGQAARGSGPARRVQPSLLKRGLVRDSRRRKRGHRLPTPLLASRLRPREGPRTVLGCGRLKDCRQSAFAVFTTSRRPASGKPRRPCANPRATPRATFPRETEERAVRRARISACPAACWARDHRGSKGQAEVRPPRPWKAHLGKTSSLRGSASRVNRPPGLAAFVFDAGP